MAVPDGAQKNLKSGLLPASRAIPATSAAAFKVSALSFVRTVWPPSAGTVTKNGITENSSGETDSFLETHIDTLLPSECHAAEIAHFPAGMSA
jgi:hypothetical protein